MHKLSYVFHITPFVATGVCLLMTPKVDLEWKECVQTTNCVLILVSLVSVVGLLVRLTNYCGLGEED